MDFDRKREDEQQPLRDVVPEQQKEHALEVVQAIAPPTMAAEASTLEKVVEVMPAALPLELWANDLLEDARQEVVRRANNEQQQQKQPPPVLFSAPAVDVAFPSEPTPYLFSAVRSDDSAFGGDAPSGPPSGGPPGSPPTGAGLPPPPDSDDDDDDNKPAARDARAGGTKRASAPAKAARSSSGSSTSPAPKKK